MPGLMIEFGSKEKGESKSDSSDSYDSDMESIMKDFLGAVASKDPKIMASAFKAAHAACMAKHKNSEDSETEK